MSTLIEKARLNAYEHFVAFKTYIKDDLIQRHSNDCVSACFRAVSSRACLRQSPVDGLTWSETLMEAAAHGLYLQPVFDLHLTGLTAILLCTSISRHGDGHAFLVQIHEGEAICVYDPASGIFASFSSDFNKEWTHAAIVYSVE